MKLLKWLFLFILSVEAVCSSPKPTSNPGSLLYWTDENLVFSAEEDGSNINQVISDPGVLRGVSVCRDWIFYVSQDLEDSHFTIRKATLNGTQISELNLGTIYPSGLIVDACADRVYWMESSSETSDAKGHVRVASFDGTRVKTIVNDAKISTQAGMAIDYVNGWIYVAGGTGVIRMRFDGLDMEVNLGNIIIICVLFYFETEEMFGM